MKAVVISACLASTFVLCSNEAKAAPVDVAGDVVNRAGKSVGSFAGTLEILNFALDDTGNIIANGELSGDVMNRAGNVRQTLVDEPVSLPLQVIEALETPEGLCQVLSLSLGPLDLNVLGLIVHLDEVNLDVTADPTGGLLGSLLCLIAGLDLGELLGGLLGGILGLIEDLLGLGDLAAIALLGELLDFLNGLL